MAVLNNNSLDLIFIININFTYKSLQQFISKGLNYFQVCVNLGNLAFATQNIGPTVQWNSS